MVSAFSFQVTTKGVIMNFRPGLDFEEVKTSLEQHVQDARDFFTGVDIYLNLAGRDLTINEMSDLMEVVRKYENVNQIYFTAKENKKKRHDKNQDTILIRRTLRSGQRIKYHTNIVVIGDVNPGAEVIAGGDIIVLGKLRGVVHAGAGGREEAQVVALSLQPTQLRIASIISRPPDEGQGDNLAPERAYIKKSQIVVDKLRN